MSAYIAALPMYDWFEVRARVDAQWAAIRDRLREAGIDAPEHLLRRNGDMPAVPGGIRGADGKVIAPDPATLPPDELDLATLWRHPKLLFSQTCWGPMKAMGLADHVRVVSQPDYSDVPGGLGTSYSSAIVGRATGLGVLPPQDGQAHLPLDQIARGQLAFNERHSLSGFIALLEDLTDAGAELPDADRLVETGGHRNSIRAVAEGRADIAAIDCRSWALAQRFEHAAAGLVVVGWTRRRLGLPYIASRSLDKNILDALRDALKADGLDCA